MKNIFTNNFRTFFFQRLFGLILTVFFFCNIQKGQGQCTAPVATATPPAQTICSGGTTSIGLSSTIPGTAFSFTVTQTNVTGASAGTATSIIQTLTATGTIAGTAVYTVTPQAGGCVGSPIMVTVTVVPLAVATATPSSQTICTGTAPSIALSSNISGTSFSWTVVQTNVTGATNGGGSPISQTLSATTSTAGTAVYTITPSANGCTGTPITVTITVTPTPLANFSYTGSPYCQSTNPPFPTFGSGASAGVFSATPAGLAFININSGQVDLQASSTGTYTVTNFIAANGGCASSSASGSITIVALDNPNFNYSSTTYCKAGTNPTPTITGLPGGSFTANPVGLSINSSTGNINLATCSFGTYVVAYTTNGSCPNTSSVNVSITNAVWPGDVNNDSLVNNNDLLTVGLFYGQTGFARASVSNVWQADSSADWGVLENNGVDIKTADCNGDGSIDANDTLAINLNFSLTHLIPTFNNNNNERLTAPDIYFITSGSSYNAGDMVDVEVWLGNSTTPVNNLYGIAFNINYNSSLVQAGTESITYPSSWLGTPGTNALKISKTDPLSNTVYGVVTRIDHANASGFGKIADFKFQVKTSLTSPAAMHFSISNYMADNATGGAQVFNAVNDSITVNPTTTAISEVKNISGIVIAPNPNNGKFNLSINNLNSPSQVFIIDVLGNIVQKCEWNNKNLNIDISLRAKGIYFVKIENREGIKVEKIIYQ